VSAENVELVRRALESLSGVGRTDPEDLDPEQIMPDVWARLDPDMELHERPDLPDTKIYRGREDSKAFWRKISELFSEISWEPLKFIDLEHAVVVQAKLILVGRGSDVPLEAAEADVCWFRDGRIVRIQGFPTLEEALAAARSIEP
jgi:ketosteroid isomerase-like protein